MIVSSTLVRNQLVYSNHIIDKLHPTCLVIIFRRIASGIPCTLIPPLSNRANAAFAGILYTVGPLFRLFFLITFVNI